MKISNDLTVKLAIAGAVGVLGYVLVRKIAGAASEGVKQAAVFVNPADPQNLVNRAVTAVGDAVVSDDGKGRNADGSWTFGGWWYDLTHPTEVAQIKQLSKPVNKADTSIRGKQTYADTLSSNASGWDNTPGIY